MGSVGEMSRRPGTVVMGVLNVTVDSFSDGGRYLDADVAIAHGVALAAAGADIVDVGGESTRPGAARVDPHDEASRVVPVVKGLAAQGITVSVDTMRARVAEQVLAAGASVINDVSGGRADDDMAKVVAAQGVPWILMHWRPMSSANPRDFRHTDSNASADHYDDVVSDVRTELLRQVDHAMAAGVSQDNLILDPGLGFAKTADHNWALLRSLSTFVDTGFPILVGASRKRFLGSLLADSDGPRPAAGRDIATAAVSTLAAHAGVWGVRVHDASASRDAVAVADEWRKAPDGGAALVNAQAERVDHG